MFDIYILWSHFFSLGKFAELAIPGRSVESKCKKDGKPTLKMASGKNEKVFSLLAFGGCEKGQNCQINKVILTLAPDVEGSSSPNSLPSLTFTRRR